jgi:hypothetical protein
MRCNSFCPKIQRQDCKFFVRDFLEYIRRVVLFQTNITKINQEEKQNIREKGFAEGIVDSFLVQDLSYNHWRPLLTIMPCTEKLQIFSIDLLEKPQILQVFLVLQTLNNKFRSMVKTYAKIAQNDDPCLNNKLFGVLTDG